MSYWLWSTVPSPLLMLQPTFEIFFFQLKVMVRLVVSHPDVATPPLVKSVKSLGVKTSIRRVSETTLIVTGGKTLIHKMWMIFS